MGRPGWEGGREGGGRGGQREREKESTGEVALDKQQQQQQCPCDVAVSEDGYKQGITCMSAPAEESCFISVCGIV